MVHFWHMRVQPITGFPSQDLILFLVQILALVGVLIRIRVSGLQQVYPYFFSYLVAQTMQLAVPLVGRGTETYAYLYLITEGVIVCFYALVLLELYAVVLRDLTGIATVARRYIRWSLAAAIAISLLLVEVQRTPATILGVFFTFERTIVSSLLVFVVLITAFLAYFPIPLNRNVIYYSVGYSVYFTCRVIALLFANSGSKWASADLAAFWGSTACLLFWAVFLRESGEVKPIVVGHQWKLEDHERLLGQLKAINATLLRVRD